MTITVMHASGTKYTFRIPRDPKLRERVLAEYVELEWFVTR